MERGLGKRLIVIAATLLPLAVPTTAAALPFLSVGNARHVLERRFEHQEEEGEGIAELANCYRVSSTHVNCYVAYHVSAYRCEVNLWHVWETASQRERQHGAFTMHTQGRYWSSNCEAE
jgi:hypothetical protein